MLKRILIGWFGVVLSCGGIDLSIYGNYSWRFRNSFGIKLIGILIVIVGIYMVLYAITPQTALKISKKIFTQKK